MKLGRIRASSGRPRRPGRIWLFTLWASWGLFGATEAFASPPLDGASCPAAVGTAYAAHPPRQVLAGPQEPTPVEIELDMSERTMGAMTTPDGTVAPVLNAIDEPKRGCGPSQRSDAPFLAFKIQCRFLGTGFPTRCSFS